MGPAPRAYYAYYAYYADCAERKESYGTFQTDLDEG